MLKIKIIIAILFLLKMNIISAQSNGLEIEGKSVLGDLVTLNTTKQGNSDTTNTPQGNLKSLVVDNNGVVLSAINGAPVVVGGFNPGTQTALYTAETGSSITRIRYIAYLDQSSANIDSYAFGDITIAFVNGRGTIINMTSFDALGNPKNITNDTAGGDISDQKTILLNNENFTFIVRSDGRIGVTVGSAILSYIFEFTGGI